MPCISVQVMAQTVGPEGQPAVDAHGQAVLIPPQQAMQMMGPVTHVTVSLAQSMVSQLAQQGIPVPPSISGHGLIDTGASVTCIDEAAARDAGFPIIDRARMSSASHEDYLCNVYPIQVAIDGLPMSIEIERGLGASLASQGLLILIGRDLLQHGTLVYSGFTGTLTLCL